MKPDFVSECLVLEKGETWFFPDLAVPALLTVRKGLVDVTAHSEDGMSVILTTASGGQHVLIFRPADPSIAFALEAIVPSVLVPSRTGLPEGIIQEMCFLYERAAEFALLKVSARLRLLLLRRSRFMNGTLSVTRLARILGCRRETASRTLSRNADPITIIYRRRLSFSKERGMRY